MLAVQDGAVHGDLDGLTIENPGVRTHVAGEVLDVASLDGSVVVVLVEQVQSHLRCDEDLHGLGLGSDVHDVGHIP